MRWILILAFLTAPIMSAQDLSIQQQFRQMQSDATKVARVSQRFQQFFGPMPALAGTPFLGMAVITGAALVTEHSDSAFAQHLNGYDIVREAKTYASWPLFTLLVVLALATALGNAGKLQGSVGKFVRLVEGASVGGAYLVLVMRGLGMGGTETLARGIPALQAGFIPAFEFGYLTLAITATVALLATMLVRFAFDVLIWLTPVPFIDLLFEIAKTLLSLLFIVLYLFNPFAAAVVAALLLLPVLFLLPWAMRLFDFAYRIVIAPLLATMIPAFRPTLHGQPSPLTGTKPAVSCRGNVLKARGLKKRQSVIVTNARGHTTLHPVHREKKARALGAAGEYIVAGKALAWIEVRVLDSAGRILDQVALPYSLAPHYSTLCQEIGAYDVGHIGLMKAARSAARAAMDGVEAAARAAQERIGRTT